MAIVDARGKSCPMPIVLTAKTMKTLSPGERVVVQANDRAFPQDIEAWCQKTGNVLISLSQKPGYFEAEIQRAR